MDGGNRAGSGGGVAVSGDSNRLETPAGRSPRRARRRSRPRGPCARSRPCAKIRPTPWPAATPMSASRASPGPLTTQPMTATLIGVRRSRSRRGDLLGDRDEVDLAAPARGTAHELGTAAPHVERRRGSPSPRAPPRRGRRSARRAACRRCPRRAGCRCPPTDFTVPGQRGARLGHADVQRVADRDRRAAGTRRRSS